MNYKIKFLAFIAFIPISILLVSNDVGAQSCSGTLNCCSSQTCNYPVGSSCFNNCGSGSCTWTYNNCDSSIQCSLNTSPSCNSQAACTAVSKNIVVGGSCTLSNPTPPPTSTPPPVGNLCDNWASPNSCHQNSGDSCYYQCNSSGTGWIGPSGPGCSGSCGGGGGPTNTPTPPPSGGACSGITYSFVPTYSKYEANTAVTVNINRAGGTSCSGNWDNVNLTFDGVNRGIAITGPTTYTSTINTAMSGLHTVQFTVNNGACTCNTTIVNTMPDGTFTSASCTVGQPYDDLSYTLTANVTPNTCTNFNHIRYWLALSEDNILNLPLLDDIGRSNATWAGNYGGGPGIEYLYMFTQVNTIVGSTVTTVWDDADLLGSSGWTINDVAQWTVNNGQTGRNFNIGGNIMCDGIQNDWIGDRLVQLQPNACAPEPVCNDILPDYGDFDLLPGERFTMNPNIDTTPPNSTTDVNFSSTNTPAAYFSDPSDLNSPPALEQPYQTTSAGGFLTDLYANGSPGDTADYSIEAFANGVSMCSEGGTVTIINPAAWWQAKEGSVIATGGNVFSDIPYLSCEPDAACDPNIISFERGGAFVYTEFPGVVMSSGNSISAGSGYVSDFDLSGPLTTHNWRASSAAYANVGDYDYDFFESKVPASISRIASGGTLTSGGFTDADGYTWYFDSGPVTIANAQNLTNRKVILFAEGDVTINNTINVTDGTGFFMLVTTGDITVDWNVGGDITAPNDTTPELEGLFVADGTFASGTDGLETDTKNLHVRGSVIASNVSLDRKLIDNSVVPGELFEYGSDIVMRLPHNLTIKRIKWREVAP